MVKRPGALLAALALLLVLVPAEGTHAATSGTLHFPDLKTLPPSDVNVVNTNGVKELRFSSTAYNAGDGRLELQPKNTPKAQKTRVSQQVYTHDSAGVWRLAASYDAGTYFFHKEHDHWHFEDFARYELLSATNPGTVYRTGTKTTFCIIDLVNPDGIAAAGDGSVLTVEHKAPAAVYNVCGRNSITGLSVGWGDKYHQGLPGQSINITGLPNGQYTLRSTADPNNKIREGTRSNGTSRDDNNAGSVTFQLAGDSVTVL